MRRLLPILFGLFLLFLAIGPALLSRRPEAEVGLTVLSPHWEGIQQEFGDAFEKHYFDKTGRRIRVEFLDVGGGTGDMMRYLESAFAGARPGEGSGVDIFFGGGTDSHMRLASRGFSESVRLPDEVLSRVARQVNGLPIYDDKEHRWYGACLSGFGILYNRTLLERVGVPAPSRWEDLTDPRLRTWIGCGDPTSSGAVHMCFEIILQAYGFDRGFGVLCRLAGNVRAFNEGGSAVTRDVNMGQVACGLVIDFLALPPLRSHGAEHLGYVRPDELPVFTADPICVLRGAPHPEAARAFLEFVMSEPGQRLWHLKPGAPGGPAKYNLERYPVIPAMYDAGLPTDVIGRPPFGPGDPKAARYEPALGGRRWAILNDLLRASILDVHGELREAWEAVCRAGTPSDLIEAFGVPPVTGDELLKAAGGKPDPARRSALRNEWTGKARAKFAEVRERALRRGK